MENEILGFNINLDLSMYFDDLRKFSCVFVDISKCKNVWDVEQHIKYLFRLEDDICLVHDKFLLPKFEDAQVFRQCGTVQVQICDFIEVRKEKKEESFPSNNSALNLIQTGKSVDLSCKPTSNIMSKLNKTHCNNVSSLSTYFLDSNDKQKENQSFCSEMHSKEKYSKDKHTKKKKRNNAEDSGSDILDMSLNKVKKISHDNCFLPLEDCISHHSIINKKLNYEEESKGSEKKLKKRKRQSDILSESFSALNSIEPLVPDKFVSKRKSKKSYLENSTQDASQVLRTFCKNEDILESNNCKRAKTLKCPDEKSKTCKTSKDNKPFLCEKKEFQQIENYCSSNSEFKSYNHAENECDLEKYLNEKKKLYQNHIDTLLANTINFRSTQTFSEDEGVTNSDYAVGIGVNKDLHFSSFPNNVNQNEEQASQSGEQLAQSCLEASNTKVKRKRVRRHKKKKKSQYLEAVGPILKNLAEYNEVYKPPTPLSNGKHIYFGDNDCDEETVVDTTLSRSLETSTQGLCGENNKLNTSEEKVNRQCPSWQEELLKLASYPKPVIFHRFSAPEINSLQTRSHSQDHNLVSQSPDSRNLNSPCSGPCTTVLVANGNNEKIETCNIEENGIEVCTQEATIPGEIFKDSNKPISIDLHDVKLSNYPVIDKVVDGDLILFQLMKLNEKYVPDVSTVILAKVKCSTNFPDKLSLQIIEGSEECESFKRADQNSEETIVELSWSHLIEPRLFYP